MTVLAHIGNTAAFFFGISVGMGISSVIALTVGLINRR